LAVADVFIALSNTVEKAGKKLLFFTKTELIGYSGLVVPIRMLFSYKGNKDLQVFYFLDIFNAFVNKWQLIKRLDKYQDYYDEDIWQQEVKKDFRT
jgi:hypothetical protein